MVEILREGRNSDNNTDNNSGSLWWNVVFVIISKAPEITTNCRQVIWLRGMRYTIILI